MAADAHANFAYSTVATAPSPATSGTSLVVASGEGARFPAVPINATIWASGAQPLSSNAEIVRVTARTTDTLTITRAQESSTARTVVVGDQIAATITAKTLWDVEGLSAVPFTINNALFPLNTAGSPLAMANGDTYYVKFIVGRQATFDQYSAFVSTTAVGSSLRFGVYTDSSNTPISLVTNSEVSGVSSASGGVRTGTMSTPIVLAAGTYWIAIAAQGGAPTLGAYGAPLSATQDPGLSGFIIAPAVHYKDDNSYTGALPASFAFAYTNPLSAPRVTIRRSA